MILRYELVLLSSLASLPAWAVDTRASEGGRPRGVGPEFAKFYKSTTTFTCLSNPAITIPISRINDDFCDCPDGSDEPGTSACSFMSSLSPPQPHPNVGADIATTPNTTLALPGFYCKNKGHIPSYLPFEAVNDGHCDYTLCCDGSDEYSGAGGVQCPDKCGPIGKEYRKHQEVRDKAMNAALKRRKELINTAATMKKEVETQIAKLEQKLREEEIKVAVTKEKLAEVEKRESSRVVKGGAAGTGKGKVGVLLGLAKSRVEELRDNLDKTRKQRDSMLSRVSELEELLANLKEERNPNFNDEGVKRAVRGWEDYAARETDDHWTEAEERDLDAILQQDGESTGVNWSEFENVDDDVVDDVAALYQFTNYLPPSVQKWVDEKITSVRQILVDNGILAAPGANPNVAESKAVQDAKKVVTDAENGLSNTRRELEEAQKDLTNDYGPDSIFRALKNKCTSKDSGEYTYELCFLDNTQQKSKKGGGNTGMGKFVGFEVEYVDEDLPQDGKGLGRGDRVVMKYENGQHCWNGPNRSTRVVLGCSVEDEIWKVSESEKCVYRMEVGTAAVCGFREGAKGGSNKAEGNKDEL